MIQIIFSMIIEKSNSIKNVPTYQLKTKDNDSTINDLQSNTDINNINDNNVFNNKKKEVYKSVPIYQSKKKMILMLKINVALVIIIITT